ncbi:potassium transporter TrkA [Rhodonellum psychrophilum GCM71 = DSM 17998]|uniref:Trk system potassium uptake protein TrkA n=2 Tax=Rhodonellum TaxID=336827 RepID=U5BUK4_9BACT|nr:MULTISPECIES: Trk system potassium transporter TrkA [Rhodonellum]ERM81558.1 potassium transporter TrkA [Rhodonellum psychrophilum GCM71 = DSM 17998]MDO9552855.1 Trk system potassium transporter TrkA [Rhodonellum sp.]SDZ54211.1 trk system potassium uptake protein TrkA [Rhodonellum ikkaensis]
MGMKIVIAGAGDMGYHLAEHLSYDNKDIILIDTDKDVLDNVSAHLDVLTILGDSTSLEVLKSANVKDAHMVMAVTTSEKTNIVTASLAKQLGANRVLARVRTHDYLSPENDKYFKNIGIDNIISPTMLGSAEIYRMIKNSSFSDVFEFEQGKLNVVGITLDQYSSLVNKKISETSNLLFEDIRIIAIVRDQLTIIPKGNTIIRNNDHVFFISNKKNVESIIAILDQKRVDIKNVMIIGGDDMAFATSLKLEAEYRVTLIHRDKERCKWLSERLDKTLVINGDYKNVELLIEEGLEQMDAFISLTESSETNIITSLSAKNHGVYKTIAHVDTREYIHISHSIGVDSLINKKLVAANQITRFLRKGNVEAVSGIYGVDAEFIQFVVTKNNRVTKKALKDLHFPETAIVAGVIRNDDVFIPDGDFILQINDKAIVMALPEAKIPLEKLFH